MPLYKKYFSVETVYFAIKMGEFVEFWKIPCNTENNAHSCVAQLIVRMKPYIKRTVGFYKQNPKNEICPTIIDIYQQFSDKYETININPFIHSTYDYSTDLNPFSPQSKKINIRDLLAEVFVSTGSASPTQHCSFSQRDICFTYLKNKKTNKSERSCFFEINLLNGKKLSEIIKSQYSKDDSTGILPAFLFFCPNNSENKFVEFEMDYVLNFTEDFKLFTVIISLREEPHKFILFVFGNDYINIKNPKWLKIENEIIEVINDYQFREYFLFDQYQIELFGFTNSIHSDVIFRIDNPGQNVERNKNVTMISPIKEKPQNDKILDNVRKDRHMDFSVSMKPKPRPERFSSGEESLKTFQKSQRERKDRINNENIDKIDVITSKNFAEDYASSETHQLTLPDSNSKSSAESSSSGVKRTRFNKVEKTSSVSNSRSNNKTASSTISSQSRSLDMNQNEKPKRSRLKYSLNMYEFNVQKMDNEKIKVEEFESNSEREKFIDKTKGACRKGYYLFCKKDQYSECSTAALFDDNEIEVTMIHADKKYSLLFDLFLKSQPRITTISFIDYEDTNKNTVLQTKFHLDQRVSDIIEFGKKHIPGNPTEFYLDISSGYHLLKEDHFEICKVIRSYSLNKIFFKANAEPEKNSFNKAEESNGNKSTLKKEKIIKKIMISRYLKSKIKNKLNKEFLVNSNNKNLSVEEVILPLYVKTIELDFLIYNISEKFEVMHYQKSTLLKDLPKQLYIQVRPCNKSNINNFRICIMEKNQEYTGDVFAVEFVESNGIENLQNSILKYCNENTKPNLYSYVKSGKFKEIMQTVDIPGPSNAIIACFQDQSK